MQKKYKATWSSLFSNELFHYYGHKKYVCLLTSSNTKKEFNLHVMKISIQSHIIEKRINIQDGIKFTKIY